ncbi:MAG: PACE efflux transporter [Francisellaceae bacterium]
MNIKQISFKTRVIHMLLFEIIGLLLVVPLAIGFVDHSPAALGVMAVLLATIAMFWVFIYNWVFDYVEACLGGRRFERSIWLRVFHSIGFEFSLCAVTLPFIAMGLGVTMVEAFILDLAFIGFYLIYALLFNWIFDYAYIKLKMTS